MNAGKLRHQIVLQQKTNVPDATYGGISETWATVATVWANVEPLQGRELNIAQTVKAETTTRISIRYLSTVTANMRATCEGKTYNILAVIDPENRHRELQLLCQEGVNDG